jgi:hypothetical protein
MMRGLLTTLILTSVLMAVGCARSPIREDQARTPYQRYAMLRGTDAPPVTVDSFGREKPDLRARLSQPDQR